MSKWFEKMGLDYNSWAELKAHSPEEALRGFLGELGKLEGREKTLAITDMFGLENLDKISTLAGALDNYDKAIGLNKENYKGSMEAEYKARAATTAFEFTKLKGTIDRISVTIGDTLLPYINALASKVNELIQPLSKWIKNNEYLIRGIITGVGALFAFKIVSIGVSTAGSMLTMVIYPLQKAFILLRFSTIGASVALLRQRAATIANTIATKAHTIATFGATAATKAWGVATTLFAKLFRVSMWSVRGALISTGIGALIVGLGLAIEYVCSNWESIAPRLVAVWEWIKGAISPIMDWFSEIFAWIGNGIDTILSGARAVTDFLGITDSKDSKNTATSPSLSTNGLVDSTLATQTQNAQNFYNSTQSRQINDNKTIYINTTASAQEVAQVIASNSYSYAD